jgi:hypothetical protein
MKASSAPLLVSAIMLGVKDVDRAKKRPWVARSTKTPRVFVRCSLGEGSSVLVRYEWEAAAQDAGAPRSPRVARRLVPASPTQGTRMNVVKQRDLAVDQYI